MFPGEISVSSLLSNDPKRCVNKHLTHLSAAQAGAKSVGKEPFQQSTREVWAEKQTGHWNQT